MEENKELNNQEVQTTEEVKDVETPTASDELKEQNQSTNQVDEKEISPAEQTEKEMLEAKVKLEEAKQKTISVCAREIDEVLRKYNCELICAMVLEPNQTPQGVVKVVSK